MISSGMSSSAITIPWVIFTRFSAQSLQPSGKTGSIFSTPFGTQSYFTGARAVPGIFIQDAPLLSEWNFGV